MTAPVKPPPLLPPIISRQAALIRLEERDYPAFRDDLDTASLKQAAQQSLMYYQSLPPDQLFVLGQDTYTAKSMAASMSAFVKILERHPDSKDWLPILLKEFVVYQSVGTDERKKVVFTSYFEPTIQARLKRDETFKFPLYARPPDLLDVDLSLFDPNYQGARVVGRREGRAVIPYHKRSEIEAGKQFTRQGLEIAWAQDAFDVLDLQIEGSGWLDLGNSERVRIRYDGDNGHRFRSVGQHLITTGRIPKKQFSREAFREYLKKHPQERQQLLNVNDRFIFFRLDMSTSAPYAFGNLRVPLTAGRSMATDPKLFPKGALAWIQVSRESPVQRFMVNQDEGGAIQGPGRVDIFAGAGEKALAFANRLMNEGTLFFFVKKDPKDPKKTH